MWGWGEVNYLTPSQRLTVAYALKTIPVKIWLCTLSLIAGWYRLQEQTMYSAAQQLYIANSKYLQYHREEEYHVSTLDINLNWHALHSMFSFSIKCCAEKDFNGCSVQIQYHEP